MQTTTIKTTKNGKAIATDLLQAIKEAAKTELRFFAATTDDEPEDVVDGALCLSTEFFGEYGNLHFCGIAEGEVELEDLSFDHAFGTFEDWGFGEPKLISAINVEVCDEDDNKVYEIEKILFH